MKTYVIEQDADACIGCGACESVCPENWEMYETDEGEHKARPKKKEIAEDELVTNKDAADSCPMNAIRVSEKEE